MSLRQFTQGTLLCLPTLTCLMVLLTSLSPESTRTDTAVNISSEMPLPKPDSRSDIVRSQRPQLPFQETVTTSRLFKQSSPMETNLSSSEKPTSSTSTSPETPTSTSGSTSVHSAQSLPSRRWRTLWRGSRRLPFVRVEVQDGGLAVEAKSSTGS